MKVASYLQGVATELRKVQWPTFATVAKYFAAVVIGVTIAAVVIFGLDTLFIRGLALIIN